MLLVNMSHVGILSLFTETRCLFFLNKRLLYSRRADSVPFSISSCFDGPFPLSLKEILTHIFFFVLYTVCLHRQHAVICDFN